MRLKLSFILSVFVFLFSQVSSAQCGPGTPAFTVDLTGDPGGVWTSPAVVRNDNCCGSTSPDRCIKFNITLDSAAVGISFDIISGALPPGALYYQIGCGPLHLVGTPICLSGTGPHVLTFCKPGNNQNIYQISSIPAAVAGKDVSVNEGCTTQFNATGFNTSTITWHSIYPGLPGAYDSYLSCTSGCLNPTITPGSGHPPYVDYVVCGQPAANCNFQTVCDTVRAILNSTLAVVIVPINPTVCFGQTSTIITANGSGGTPPYTYLWNNVNPSQSINVGAGVFTVRLSDASNCPPTYASVTVTSFSVTISADAGPDDTVCVQQPVATLNASVTGASGGVWSGGAGVFSPNNTSLICTYTPTAAELANGFVDLRLITTGNGTCPADTDFVRIYYKGFTGTVTVTPVNVSCFGGNNGSATVNVSGGISPYSYFWNTAPAQTTATADNLPIGTYSVTIQNGIGCTLQTTVVITQPAPLAVNSVVTNVSCFGGSNGSVSLSPWGGMPSYTYLWQPGNQTSSSVTALTIGTYSVTVRDSKNCQITATYAITQPPQLSVTLSTTNVSCFSGNNGSITSASSGGVAPYTYNWSPIGISSPNASGVFTGTYTVTITDNSGCTVSAAASITQPPALGVLVSGTNEVCNYLNNGTAAASVSGGTPAYSYNWQPGGQTSGSVSNLSAGTYTLTVTDIKGCKINSLITITEPPALAINFINKINVSCFGGNNGAVTANVMGGIPGYSYLWTPGSATTAAINNLLAGSYTLTATDNNGCEVQSSISITQPPVALSVTVSSTAVSCHGGANGTLSSSAAGGSMPYTYNWQPGNYTGSPIANLFAGTYTVTTTDANGCTIAQTVTITEPPVIDLTPGSINSFCGAANGNASVSVSGGVSPYSYQWWPTGGTGQTAAGLLSGAYTVTVTDNNGCAVSTGINVNNTAGPSVTISSTTNVNCNGGSNGSATVIAAGGTTPYTYSWSPSGGVNSMATGLTAGTYTVTVLDANGCQAFTTAPAITQPALIVITTAASGVSCFGGNNGAVTANVIGGTPVYNYLWTPGSVTTASLNNLSAGSYTISITDNNGCKAQSSVIVNQSPLLSVTASATAVSCPGGANGTISASAVGGAAPYTYNWQPGNYAGQNISNVMARTYTVTATDGNGCVSLNTVAVTEPPAIILTINIINASCTAANGQAAVTISGGGSAPYSYQWSPTGGTGQTATGLFSGSYTVVVTDANGCTVSAMENISNNAGPVAAISSLTNVSCFGGSNGSATVGATGGTLPYTYSWSPSGGTNATASGLVAGSYVVTVLDGLGCQSVITTNPVITEPPLIVITTNTSGASCFGGGNGSASVSASGGVPGYNYTWLPGGTTGATINGLSANTYTVKVTDANSCVQTATFIIGQAAPLVSSIIASSNVSCFGGNNGTATVGVSGGTPFYNYNWAPLGGNGPVGAGLTSGTYTVTTTDANGCTITQTVTITEPPVINLTPGSINSFCGAANGNASVSVSGGVSPYSYQWWPTGGTGQTAAGLLSGAYTVTVTDNNGCAVSTGINVNNTAGPSVTISSTTNVSCNGGSNGSATVIAAGGTTPYTYSWSSSGGVNSMATGLTAGTYTVTVLDANGCQAFTTAPAITQPALIVITTAASGVSCFGGNDGSASASSSGGVSGYNYTWLPGGTTGNTISGLSASTYTVQVTDANNCVQTATFIINPAIQLVSSIFASSNVSCFGGNNGTATVNVSGGAPFYNYSWSPLGGNGPTGAGLAAGSYTVNIVDSKGCTSFSSITITEPTQALAGNGTSVSTSCFGGSDGSASVTPIGGTPGYVYQWNPVGGTGQTALGLTAGNYTVLVTDANGCQTSVLTSVSQPSYSVTGILVPANPSCGLSNGSILSQISGGTGPYSYLWTPGSSTGASISGLGPGSYTLQVTDASCSVKGTFTITLSNIAGPSGVVSLVKNVSCFGGNDGSATVNVTQGTAPYLVNWLPYSGNKLSAASLIAGIYTVNITDALGCTAIATTTITEPAPVVVSVSSATSVSCKNGNNGSIMLTVAGGMPIYNYLWQPLVSSSDIANSLTAGTYTVIVSDQNNCSTSIAIKITEPPIMLSSIGSITNPTCSGGNGSATVISAGGTTPYSYMWSTAPAQTGNSATLSAGSYTVTTTDANGCTITTTAVISEPAQVITTAGPNDTVCIGQSINLTATASGGAGNYQYAWQPSGAINGGTLNVTPSVNTTYTVIAYDQNGCAGTPGIISAAVYSLTPGNVMAIGFSPICPGQSSTVYVQTSGSTGPLTYLWNNGLGTGPGAFLVTPTQPTTYIVTVTNSCGISVTSSTKILFNPPPTISLMSDTNLSCVPAAIQFFDNSVTGNLADPITSWYWSFGDGTSSTLSDPKHVYTQSGVYFVSLTVTTSGGCTNNNGSAPIVITAYPSPKANFTTSPSVTPMQSNNPTVDFKNTSTGAIKYFWDFGDGITSTNVDPQHHFGITGVYTITLISTNIYGCTDTFRIRTSGGGDISFPTAFTPNPNGPNGGSYNLFNLDNDVFFPFAAGVDEFRMQIFNRWGELIFETLDIKIGWDGYYRGKLCQQDVYVWKANVKFNDGRSITRAGDVTLLR